MEFDTADIHYIPTTGVSRVHDTPVVIASDETLKGYGCLVGDPQTFPIEIVQWPAQGWRKIDDKSGDQGGVTEGLFEFWWKGETLFARNNAVGDSYLFGWSNWPDAHACAGRWTASTIHGGGWTNGASGCSARCNRGARRPGSGSN